MKVRFVVVDPRRPPEKTIHKSGFTYLQLTTVCGCFGGKSFLLPGVFVAQSKTGFFFLFLPLARRHRMWSDLGRVLYIEDCSFLSLSFSPSPLSLCSTLSSHSPFSVHDQEPDFKFSGSKSSREPRLALLPNAPPLKCQKPPFHAHTLKYFEVIAMRTKMSDSSIFEPFLHSRVPSSTFVSARSVNVGYVINCVATNLVLSSHDRDGGGRPPCAS